MKWLMDPSNFTEPIPKIPSTGFANPKVDSCQVKRCPHCGKKI